MGKIEKHPRLQEAEERFEKASNAAHKARCELERVREIVLADHALKPDNLTVPGTWDCEESPVGKCVYHFFEDPCHDQCIFCGDPEERK